MGGGGRFVQFRSDAAVWRVRLEPQASKEKKKSCAIDLVKLLFCNNTGRSL